MDLTRDPIDLTGVDTHIANWTEMHAILRDLWFGPNVQERVEEDMQIGSWTLYTTPYDGLTLFIRRISLGTYLYAINATDYLIVSGHGATEHRPF
jgi:hypothetical protein